MTNYHIHLIYSERKLKDRVAEEDKLTVFPRGGPFLATQKIGKNNPKEAEIRKSNEMRQEWNAAVSDAMVRGMPVEDLKEMKKKLIVEPVAGSIKKHGKDPSRFIRILKKAVAVLIEKARSFRPSILASLERFKTESAEQDRQRRSARKAVKDRELMFAFWSLGSRINTGSKTVKTGKTTNISLPFDFAVLNANNFIPQLIPQLIPHVL